MSGMDPRVAPTPLFIPAGMSWFGLVAAPAAWSLNHVAGYALVGWACASGQFFVLPLLTCVLLLVALAGAWRAAADACRFGSAELSDARVDGRARFAALAGLGLSVLVALVLALDVLAELVIGPCPR